MDPKPDFAQRFAILRELALAAAGGDKDRIRALLEVTLGEAMAAASLSAASLKIGSSESEDTLTVVIGDTEFREQIQKLEKTLLAELRAGYSLGTAYMTLEHDEPIGLFSIPLRLGQSLVGTITGLARGGRNLASEDEFLGALAAQLALAGQWLTQPAHAEGIDTDESAKIRADAVSETATTLSHEINNPLMAVLGNLELLIRQGDRFDRNTLERLRKMEAAAVRIRDVTAQLMQITRAESTSYLGDSKMIDLDASKSSTPKKPSSDSSDKQ